METTQTIAEVDAERNRRDGYMSPQDIAAADALRVARHTRVTANEAAIQIRQSGLLDEAHGLTPEDRHRANFAGRVCEILGLEPTAENMARVQQAMDKLDIEPHEGHEYPKWVPTGRKVQVYNPATGAMVDGPKDEMAIANDADEEAMIGRGEVPAARRGGYGTFQGEAPASRSGDPVLFGLKSRMPTDTVPPSERGADGAKAASGTYDQGRGPPLPPGYPNTGGRFLDENSPDRGLPGYPNAGTGRDESAGPDQRSVLPVVEGDPHPDTPKPGGASSEPGRDGGGNDVTVPNAGPSGYLHTGSNEADVSGFTQAGDGKLDTRTPAQIDADRAAREKAKAPEAPRRAPQAPRRA